jgi:ABC-type Na+ efflux pump permease subunit
MMGSSRSRIAAVARKELTEYRRNRFIVGSMAAYPAIFLILPIIGVFSIKMSEATAGNPILDRRVGLSMLYLMLVPVAVPSTVSGYSVVGERNQGTLEPLLATPIRRIEFILGKAAAIFLPSIAISYVMFGIYVAVVQLGAQPALASAVYHAPQLWAELAFAPLLCGWSIWIGLAISSKVSDTRVAQQFTLLGSLPPLAVVALFSIQVINATLTIALLLGAALLVIDLVSWFFVAKLFDRERLVTGSTSKAAEPSTPPVVVRLIPNQPGGHDTRSVSHGSG